MSTATCELCGARTRALCRLTRLGLQVGRCESCSLALILPEGLNDAVGGGNSYESYVAAQRVDSLHDRYVATLGRLTALLPAGRTNRLYDVGAGAGAFLAEARGAGFESTGNDISADAVRMCEERHGIRLSDQELRYETGQDLVDAMTMWCVLAHVDDARGLLEDAFRLLKPGGVLYFHTPRWCLIDTIGLAALRLTRGRLDNVTARRINRSHRRLYNRENMAMLLQSVGFQLIEVKPTAAYSLRTARYLTGMQVPSVAVRPIAFILDRLITGRLVPRNVLDVYVRKPQPTGW